MSTTGSESDGSDENESNGVPAPTDNGEMKSKEELEQILNDAVNKLEAIQKEEDEKAAAKLQADHDAMEAQAAEEALRELNRFGAARLAAVERRITWTESQLIDLCAQVKDIARALPLVLQEVREIKRITRGSGINLNYQSLPKRPYPKCTRCGEDGDFHWECQNPCGNAGGSNGDGSGGGGNFGGGGFTAGY